MIRPIEYNVLLRQDDIEATTRLGLHLPPDVIEKKKHAQTVGTVVAVSPMAFAFDDWPDGEPKPTAGDKVLFARHAGTFVTDPADGVEYRAVKDKDIVAVVTA